jgi:hypothetical protein
MTKPYILGSSKKVEAGPKLVILGSELKAFMPGAPRPPQQPVICPGHRGRKIICRKRILCGHIKGGVEAKLYFIGILYNNKVYLILPRSPPSARHDSTN